MADTNGRDPRITLKQLLMAETTQVSVTLIGAGGTGSNMLDGLARLSRTLQSLGHAGLHVSVFDDDVVEPHNIGRQWFSWADVRENKATMLVSRINRMYGTRWEASPNRFKGTKSITGQLGNILITAVDDNQTRNDVQKALSQGFGREPMSKDAERARKYSTHTNFINTHYWLDIGNDHRIGQLVLGSEHGLKTCVEMFGEYDETRKNVNSCSSEESLRSQDLFINQLMATMALDLLWNMFRRGMIERNVIFVNLETCAMNGGLYQLNNHGQKEQELISQLVSDAKGLRINGKTPNEIEAFAHSPEKDEHTVQLAWRHLGKWEHDEERGHELEAEGDMDWREDDDHMILAPGQLKSFRVDYLKWATSKPWFSRVRFKDETSEKCWYTLLIIFK